MASVEQVADMYIAQIAAHDPISATSWGIPGYDDRLPDLSPAGLEGRADLQRTALRDLAKAPQGTEGDRIGAEVMAERLGARLELHEAGDDLRPLRVLHSPQ